MTATTRTDPPDPLPGKAPATPPPGSGGRRRAPRLYPFTDLLEVIGHPAKHVACDLLRISGATYIAYHAEGLTEAQADRAATRAGQYPWAIWPTWGTVVCARPDCGERFMPHHPRKRYCSRACQNRQAMRALRSTPEGARSNQATSAAYRARHSDYLNKAARRRRRDLTAEQREQINAQARARYAARINHKDHDRSNEAPHPRHEHAPGQPANDAQAPLAGPRVSRPRRTPTST